METPAQPASKTPSSGTFIAQRLALNPESTALEYRRRLAPYGGNCDPASVWTRRCRCANADPHFGQLAAGLLIIAMPDLPLPDISARATRERQMAHCAGSFTYDDEVAALIVNQFSRVTDGRLTSRQGRHGMIFHRHWNPEMQHFILPGARRRRWFSSPEYQQRRRMSLKTQPDRRRVGEPDSGALAIPFAVTKPAHHGLSASR